MVPVHHLPTSQQLYVAFVDRINYSALYAVDKMLACHTEPCLAVQSRVVEALKELRRRPHPLEVIVATASDHGEMVRVISAQMVARNATGVRISGFDGFIWARIFGGSEFVDVLFQPRGLPTKLLARPETT